MSVLRATVCEGLVLELPDLGELREIARTSDYRDQRAMLLPQGARLVVDHELDNALEFAPNARPAIPEQIRRYAIRCVVTETALVFPVINLRTGKGAGFAVFPYGAITRLCG